MEIKNQVHFKLAMENTIDDEGGGVDLKQKR